MTASPSRQQPKAASFRAALVSMPWAIFNRPSIQLGSLKAFLEQNAAWASVDAFHPYLEVASRVGTATYHWISQNVWVCEALYAPLLFPSQLSGARDLVRRELRKADRSLRFDFDALCQDLEVQLRSWINSRDWRQYQLAGFSVCFNQLLPTLAAVRLLKEACPELPVVLGGSSCVPEASDGLLAVSQADYVVSGEGEQPLLGLCQYLAGKRKDLPERVFSAAKKTPPTAAPASSGRLDNLRRLPAPDYGDYVREMGRWFSGQPFIPVLPVEFSRGCWWGKCSFCNLNLQWQGYRFKKAEQMLKEVVSLAERFGSLDFTFADNVLPVHDAARFFEKLAGLRRDFRFFAEIRAGQRNLNLPALRRGGLVTVQAGIESLSDSLLKRLDKGITVIENLALMREAMDNGIELTGNLITEFPGSSPEEVAETLGNLDFALPFQPLTVAAFFLGHGSPVDCDPQRFGIRAKVAHPNNSKLFPREILKGLVLLIKGYRGDRARQRKLWQPVVQKVARWCTFHHKRRAGLFERPPLSYRDGGSFLVIRQELPDRPVLHHRLRGPSRQIYLDCLAISDIETLAQRFAGINREHLVQFLDDLVRKRLMFRDQEKYLSLAVRRK